MTVQGLIRLLEDCDPDAEVRFASQPSWPFEYSIADMYEHWPEPEPDEDGNEGSYEDIDDMMPTVYLVEGQQLDYLDGAVKREIGW